MRRQPRASRLRAVLADDIPLANADAYHVSITTERRVSYDCPRGGKVCLVCGYMVFTQPFRIVYIADLSAHVPLHGSVQVTAWVICARHRIPPIAAITELALARIATTGTGQRWQSW
jgi:hypothetical protein